MAKHLIKPLIAGALTGSGLMAIVVAGLISAGGGGPQPRPNTPALASAQSAGPAAAEPQAKLPIKSSGYDEAIKASVIADQPSWQQDFSHLPDGPPDPRFFSFDLGTGSGGWGNGEAEYYTDRPQNVRVEQGRLIIEARKESFGGANYTSARLVTKGKFDPQYGRLEVTAKLPKGTGTWPAIWLLPASPRYAVAGSSDSLNWLRDGEIDVMEHVGADEGEINGSAHSYSYNPTNQNARTKTMQLAGATGGFHTYGLNWTPERLDYLVDDRIFYTVTNPHSGIEAWPYDQPYHLILNLAMGGSWGGYKKDSFPPLGIDDTGGPWRFEISSIRYYDH